MGSCRTLAMGLLAVVIVAAPRLAYAQPAKSSSDQCFRSADVDGFNAPNDHTVYVRVGVNDIYRLDLMGDCGDLSFRQAIGLENTPASSWICSPLDATIVYRETGVAQRCPVTAIHKLTSADKAAMPKGQLP